MSDIADNSSPVQIEGARFRSPVSEALIQQIGGNINFLLNHVYRVTEFTASGSWTCPTNITRIIVVGWGGGGGGGGFNTTNQGGGGGGGSSYGSKFVTVVPTTIYAITIGAGGSGGTGGGSGTAGGDGSNTTFGALATFYAGLGGTTVRSGFPSTDGGRGGAQGGSSSTGTLPPYYQYPEFNNGYQPGAQTIRGGGGGAGPGGNGGDGKSVSGQNGGAAAANSGAGGGGAGGTTGTGSNGGAGGSGYLAIITFGEL